MGSMKLGLLAFSRKYEKNICSDIFTFILVNHIKNSQQNSSAHQHPKTPISQSQHKPIFQNAMSTFHTKIEFVLTLSVF